jgi:hypothetical protein
LFFGGFGIGLRDWFHLDDQRRGFSAAQISGGWFLSSVGWLLSL